MAKAKVKRQHDSHCRCTTLLHAFCNALPKPQRRRSDRGASLEVSAPAIVFPVTCRADVHQNQGEARTNATCVCRGAAGTGLQSQKEHSPPHAPIHPTEPHRTQMVQDMADTDAGAPTVSFATIMSIAAFNVRTPTWTACTKDNH
eukprot:359256-Chlamydomonas_euryale.AAC.3